MNSYPVSDEALFSKIQEDNTFAFNTLFTKYYKSLCHYANKIIGKPAKAEDIVQELFIRIWENRLTIQIGKSVKSYLYRSVYNRSVNYIRDTKALGNTIELYSGCIYQESYYNADNEILLSELETKLFEIINSFPEKQKNVFLLRRFENLSYKEISQNLNMSEKMVEKYLSKALAILREALIEYRGHLLIILFFLFSV